MTQPDKATSPVQLATPLRPALEPAYLLPDASVSVAQKIVIHLPPRAHKFTWRLDGLDESFSQTGEHAVVLHQGRAAGSDHFDPEGTLAYEFELPRLPNGRFTFAARIFVSDNGHADKDEDGVKCTLIVAPERCYLPPQMEARTWGPFVRLSALRSSTNWGIGDLTDLANLCNKSIQSGGAGVIALEPLQPQVSDEKRGTGGPPAFSSLSFIDPLYIDVLAVAEFDSCDEAKRTVLAPDFQERLKQLRASALVDFAAVRELKLKTLRLLYQTFRADDLRTRSERAVEFERFGNERGTALYSFSLYEAMAEHLQQRDWHSWPLQYQKRDTDAIREFEQSNTERLEFFQYLQWLADQQLRAVSDLCANLKTSLGLCYSLPLAIDPTGCEAWQNQDLIARGVKARPPSLIDGLSVNANEAALIPDRLRHSAYQVLVDALRSAQRYSGAVIVTDIAALERRIWIDDNDPAGEKPNVVRHDLQEKLAVLKLESHRGQCAILVAGWERLDNSERLPLSEIESKLGILPVMSELTFGGEVFADEAAAGPDIPVAILPLCSDDHSLVSFWLGADVQTEGLSAGVDKTLRDAVVAQRVLERVDLLRKLEKRSLLPDNVAIDPAAASVLGVDISTAFYKMLAARSMRLILIPLDDIAGRHVLQRTVSTYSNAEKLGVEISELFEETHVDDLLAYLRKEGKRVPVGQGDMNSAAPAVQAVIPDATYRFQFNKEFTLSQSYELIEYLKQLGISHLYASPLLKARPGSMHGYDIVRHDQINPEVGTTEELDRLSENLRRHDMGIVLDMVPNHMGIGKENAWWMDVLENGPASQFADYFDIDWSPIKPELRGKVTIPILGEFYGAVLHSGQLKLHFYPERGALVLRYWDSEYPINPLTYPQVLGERIELLKERLGADNFDVMEYQSIITAFSHLPGHMEPSGFSERIREKQLQMRRLSELCRRNPAVVEFILQNLQLFTQPEADRLCRQRLHRLLEAQAYRLVHWRVANDEINYRRFFDINDLAAVRTEDPRVFTEMHALILKWVEERKIDGLRIDHPDGLLDPANYFEQLQQAALERLGGGTPVPEKHDETTLPFYIVIEKILAPFERIEQDWAVQGTTGYDFLNEVLSILVRPESEEEFTSLYDEFLGHKSNYEQMKLASKRTILESVLASELNVLAHRLSQIAETSWYFRDFTLNSLRQALRLIVIHFPVYRTYVTADGADKSARQFIDWAIGKAMSVAPSNNTAVFTFIRQVLTLEASASPLDEDSEENLSFKRAMTTWAMKFQQFTSPVMAKSVEDTLFYRYTRLACLNEVGGEPERFGASVLAFHQKNQQRQQRHPYSMLATSTHDTKRSEDVRSRLAVLSELPRVWKQRINYWLRLNRSKKATTQDKSMPDANDEYLIYQTIVGACPLVMGTDEETSAFRVRIQQYMLKAAREAKRYTSWVNQNDEYESALNNFIERILTPSSTNPFLDDLSQFQSVVAPLGLANSLVQTVLKLTCPGVPDIYQGAELWDFSLVDPDNRRPVDYKLRRDLLGSMESHIKDVEHLSSDGAINERRKFAAESLTGLGDGRLKLYLIACLLRFRQMNNKLFNVGKYLPLEVKGKASDHVIAFARQQEGRWAIVIVPHLMATLLQLDDSERFKTFDTTGALTDAKTWGDTTVVLPEQIQAKTVINLFTSDKLIAADGQLLLSNVFATLPVCVLIA